MSYLPRVTFRCNICNDIFINKKIIFFKLIFVLIQLIQIQLPKQYNCIYCHTLIRVHNTSQSTYINKTTIEHTMAYNENVEHNLNIHIFLFVI